MKRSTVLWMTTAVVLASIGYAKAASVRQDANVNVKAIPPATCSCTTAGAPGMNGQRNRRGATPYGSMHFTWSTDGTANVTDEAGSVIGTTPSGSYSRSYGGYGYIYWTATCTNSVGDSTTCSDYTFLSCFPAGTLITLVDADGNTYQKAIEKIGVGETVLAWDPNTQSYVTSVVQQPIATTSNALFEMKDANGDTLKITPTHEMYIDGKGFIPSEDVKVGDVLVTNPDGQKVAITSIAKIEGTVDVYNLITSDPHDFFAQNILVHNVNDMTGHKDHGFVAGTMIQTTRGLVAIEQIKAGDKLVSWDPKTGQFRANPVLKTGSQTVSKTIKINGTLQMGTAQPMFLAKNKKAPSFKKPAAHK